MHKSQHRNIKNMKKQDNMTPANTDNCSITESVDIEMIGIPHKEFKDLV
jgi:hypothetical protein